MGRSAFLGLVRVTARITVKDSTNLPTEEGIRRWVQGTSDAPHDEAVEDSSNAGQTHSESLGFEGVKVVCI